MYISVLWVAMGVPGIFAQMPRHIVNRSKNHKTLLWASMFFFQHFSTLMQFIQRCHYSKSIWNDFWLTIYLERTISLLARTHSTHPREHVFLGYLCQRKTSTFNFLDSDQTCGWTQTIFSPSFCFPGPPSAPVNVISSVNGTSVNLEWDRPLDTGGRSDLQYSVLCQKCSGEGGPCENCASSPGGAGGGKAGSTIGTGGSGVVERSGATAVRFIPRQTGLTEPWVTVLNLVAHSNYSFRLLAMNAVSHLSNEPSPYAVVNITTNQAGRVHSTDSLTMEPNATCPPS